MVSPSLRQRVDALRSRVRPRPKPTEEARAARREGRARGAWRRFRRATDRYRLLTDVLGGILIVAAIVGGLAAATGGVWPPIVIVESGSMMHSIPETDYGRFGTIDVGDIVFVRAVKDLDRIETWAEGGRDHYGRPGDVIAYWPDGNRDPVLNKTVIHRAIAYVEVDFSDPNATYTLYWTDGQVRTWGPRGIYFPPLGFSEEFGFSPAAGYRPVYSGFITKGDNAYSNPATDQAMGISRLVAPEWIVGEVYGEVPWMGLAKLALQSGTTNPAVPDWERIGNAYAPLELWSMFFLMLALIILVPLTLDTWRAWRKLKRERETERRLQEENARRLEARRKAEAAPQKRVATFAAVVSSRPAPAQPLTGRGPPGR